MAANPIAAALLAYQARYSWDKSIQPPPPEMPLPGSTVQEEELINVDDYD